MTDQPRLPSNETEADVLSRLVRARYSCRGYKPEPVLDTVIERIFDTARHAASWCNTQPWQMIVTRPGTTEPFAEALYAEALKGGGVDSDVAFPAEYRGDFLARRRSAGFALYEAVGIQRGDNEGRRCQSLENFRFFGAPHVAILTTAGELGPYGLVDSGGFLANFLLAATANGVATIPQAAIAQHSTFIRNWFAIPDDRTILCGVSFGFADPEHPANRFRTTREEAGDIFRFA